MRRKRRTRTRRRRQRQWRPWHPEPLRWRRRRSAGTSDPTTGWDGLIIDKDWINRTMHRPRRRRRRPGRRLPPRRRRRPRKRPHRKRKQQRKRRPHRTRRRRKQKRFPWINEEEETLMLPRPIVFHFLFRKQKLGKHWWPIVLNTLIWIVPFYLLPWASLWRKS